MTSLINHVDVRTALTQDVYDLLQNLGQGVIGTVAYDTAWAARLEYRYPGSGFEDSVEWLRRNQHDNGSWGAPLLHHHDRFVSTLAATVALREVGRGPHDERSVQRGEAALWKIASRLGRDDADTVGFPIVSASLAQDAAELGLDVPRPPLRFAAKYKKKVSYILSQSNRDWRTSVLSFSLEGLRRELAEDDKVLETNHSVASCPSATAAYMFSHYDEQAMAYLRRVKKPDGGMPAFAPLDIFDIAWSLAQLQHLDMVEPDNPQVQAVLQHLWERWSNDTGSYYSSYFRVPDLDSTAACFSVLRWGGYPVDADVFSYFETEERFVTYRQETDPSATAHLRLLLALQTCPEHPRQPQWVKKVVNALHSFDENGSFWWDKWHASPYYASHLAIRALIHVDLELANTRLKWILKTQNEDGGWGYLGRSTVEETAYCIDALVLWNRHVQTIDPSIIDQGRQFLVNHKDIEHYTPLWISKELYMPINIVRSAVLSAMYHTLE